VKFLAGAGVVRVGEISLVYLERHLADLDQKGLSGSTRKRKTAAIRSFLSYLHELGFLPHDLSQILVVPYTGTTIPRVLTQGEYQRLLTACSGNVRDLAIVSLLLQTGIRLSELTGLALADIHLPECIIIRGSDSRRGRTIPLNTKACEAVQSYLIHRSDAGCTQVFLNTLGKPLGNRGVEKILSGYFRQAEISGASVQTLRHTFATHHVAKGTGLKTIQEILGLADIRSTEVYQGLAQALKRKELEEHAL
jgi:site-specific recombinase XerD